MLQKCSAGCTPIWAVVRSFEVCCASLLAGHAPHKMKRQAMELAWTCRFG